MAKGDQWEVVGGAKAKKTKSKNGKTSKSNGNGSAAFFEPSAPIKEATTIYASLQEKEIRPAPKVTDSPSRGPAKKKNKPQDKKPTTTKATLEESIAALKEEDLKSHLAALEALCPGSSLIWLKELASFLNAQVDVPVEDPTFASKPIGYPANLLSKAVQSNINKLLAKCPAQMQQIFYEFCMQSMVQESLKGLNTMGYRIVLQILANTNQSIVLSSLNKCSELCVSHQNRQNICLSVLWGAGQAGNKNLEAGMKVWLELMFPRISSKHCTSYVVDYIEKKMTEAGRSQCTKSLVDVRELFAILDFVHSKDIGKNIQKRMAAVYPMIKKLSYGPEPETTLRNYFPSYLRRLEPQCPQPLKEEILDSLLLCLEKDERCYSIWRQLYTKHLVQSKELISHLNDQWDQGCSKKMPRRLLRDTLATFQVTNEELLASGRKELKELVLVNKELLSRIDSGSFSWPRLILSLILIISSALTFDIVVHGTFADSVSGKLMKDYGLLLILTQVGEKLGYFYGRAQKLFEQYYPPAYNWLRKSLGPFVDSLFSKTCSAATVAWEATGGIRTWCGNAIPPLLAEAEKLFVAYGTSLDAFLKSFAVVVSKQVLSALAFVLDSLESASVWLQTSPQVMDTLATVKQVSLSLAENVQKNAVYLFQTVKQKSNKRGVDSKHGTLEEIQIILKKNLPIEYKDLECLERAFHSTKQVILQQNESILPLIIFE
ncbi:hypothetical protein JTE90_012086 [Oedothorax gibbosus]|uniref:Transmembrane protein 214 n=1 Tax=Oedothorax gibbosus TaxID=931172 RepID=A0AAV6UKA0_9ARAC|nr:hypothetical protein JTE90_012086 [Oedothorax gibbosus]